MSPLHISETSDYVNALFDTKHLVKPRVGNTWKRNVTKNAILKNHISHLFQRAATSMHEALAAVFKVEHLEPGLRTQPAFTGKPIMNELARATIIAAATRSGSSW